MRLSIYLSALLSTATTAHQTCRARNLPAIEVPGVRVVDIHAKETLAFEDWGPPSSRTPPGDMRPIDFCNITITYTHPGENDTINVYVWLPLEEWNGRLIGQGGGGFSASHQHMLPSGVADGYVTANTDAGHTIFTDTQMLVDPAWWMYHGPGEINWSSLEDFASRALGELPKIAKQVINGYYGKPAKYAYWNGCSTGGRQGLMSAQRFPTDYDGILAGCPAINWASLVVAEWWPQLQMRQLGYYPPQCERDAITRAAIESCDELDGIKDGVIGAPGLCKFDATTIVGQNYDCNGDSRQIRKEAALIANAGWAGAMPRDGDKHQGWYGISHEAASGGPTPFSGLSNTICDENSNNCRGLPFPLTEAWIRYFVMKDADYNVTNMSEDDFWMALHKSRAEFGSIIGTNDPDLSGLKASGAKMISWHGLADSLISPNGTTDYYERALAVDPDLHNYYRHFEAPGVGHCHGGAGAYPHAMWQDLISWVELGVVPQRLEARTTPMDESEPVRTRILCPFPQTAEHVGGNVDRAESFECVGSLRIHRQHDEL